MSSKPNRMAVVVATDGEDPYDDPDRYPFTVICVCARSVNLSLTYLTMLADHTFGSSTSLVPSFFAISVSSFLRDVVMILSRPLTNGSSQTHLHRLPESLPEQTR